MSPDATDDGLDLVNGSAARIDVEVAYALPERQTVIALDVAAGTTARQAIVASGILDHYPDLDLAQLTIGVYGEVVGMDRILEHEDRVEIYRPLEMDPRAQRRRRLAGR